MQLIAAGVNFRTAPLAVRERVVVDNSRAGTVLKYLVGHAGLAAAAVLSTCNRTEFYVVAPTVELADQVVPRLGRYLDSQGEDVSQYLESHVGDAALHHIFRVAAGLDSRMVGETQVLGQMKRAHRLALEAGCLDARLDFILRRALSLGKRVHSQDLLSAPPGLADAAVDLVGSRLGGIGGRSVVVVGAGDTATTVARLLDAEGARLVIAARGPSGRALANSYEAPCIALDDIGGLDDVDAVVSCTSSSQPVVSVGAIDELQRHRGGAPLLVIDLAVPRDVELAAGDIAGVELVDVDSVAHIGGESNNGYGPYDLVAAEVEVDTEVLATSELLRERDTAGEAIAALGSWADQVRDAELARTLERMPELTPGQRERIEAMARSLVKRLLHNPIAAMRESAEDPDAALSLLQVFDVRGEAVSTHDTARSH